MRWLFGALLCFVLLPHAASASVRINEVAWMGTQESYLCNWIELYNQGDQAVTVTDWTLEIDDTVRELRDGEGNDASATIPAGGFLLLERVTNTCPDPVPTAAGLYLTLGNLPNRGATLTLRRADGTMADRIVGGEEWRTIGGDNDTKETAQRTSAGWVTDPPTPGAKNQAAGSETKEDENKDEREAVMSPNVSETQEVVVVGSNNHRATELEEDGGDLSLAITGPTTTYVGQPVVLTVAASGMGTGVTNSLHYQWSFGDRHSSTKEAPRHSYRFPGTYVVTVRGVYGDYSATARHEVTVLPVRLSLGRDQYQNVQLHNEAPYELDLSGYTVSGTQSFTFPARTILLPGQTITIEQTALENEVAGLVLVQNTEKEVVADNMEAIRTQYIATAETASTPTPTVAGVSQRVATHQPAALVATATPEAATPTTSTTGVWSSQPPQPIETKPVPIPWLDYWPYLALFGLCAAGAVIVFWSGRRNHPAEPATDWFA